MTTLNLTRFFIENTHALDENKTDEQVIAAVEVWKHSDFLCKNYVLNDWDNTLYNVYCTKQNAKELWDFSDKNIGRFLEFLMVDSKTIISQVQEIQVILYEIHAK